jgi:hypothetical protein
MKARNQINAASISSSIFAASQPFMTGEPSISSLHPFRQRYNLVAMNIDLT